MSNKTQSGRLPEKHKTHLTWPPIVKMITIITNVVQGAKGINSHNSVIGLPLHTAVKKNTLGLFLKREV